MRFGNVVVESVKIVSPPQSGTVAVQGPAFTYQAKPDFNGQDLFSLAAVGAINQIPGNSIIVVTVSVGQQPTLPSRQRPGPAGLTQASLNSSGLILA